MCHPPAGSRYLPRLKMRGIVNRGRRSARCGKRYSRGDRSSSPDTKRVALSVTTVSMAS